MVIYSGFTMIYPLKIVIFHSYVSLPEGKWIFLMEFKDVYNVYYFTSENMESPPTNNGEFNIARLGNSSCVAPWLPICS